MDLVRQAAAAVTAGLADMKDLLGYGRAITAVSARLEDSEMSVRRAAIEGLLDYGEIDVILARLDDDCWEMKLAVVRAIFTFAWWQGLMSADKSPTV